MKRQLIATVSLLIAIMSGRAIAADHNNLDEGLPTQLDDAYPIEYCGREVQTALSYERTAEGKDLFMVEPRLELGFAPNWQATLHVPFEFGSGAAEGIGAVGAEALYNFNTQGIWLPAFAVSGRADFPTGPATHGVDTTAKFILTKSLGRTSFFNQLHLNIAWMTTTMRVAARARTATNLLPAGAPSLTRTPSESSITCANRNSNAG